MAYRFKARSITPGEYNFAAGTLGFAPPTASVLYTNHIGDGVSGTYYPPEVNEVISTITFGDNNSQTGTVILPNDEDVRNGVVFGPQ